MPIEEHTTDDLALEANKRLVAEGLDIEGLFFSQAAFQVLYPADASTLLNPFTMMHIRRCSLTEATIILHG